MRRILLAFSLAASAASGICRFGSIKLNRLEQLSKLYHKVLIILMILMFLLKQNEC
jgi:hypothetical protein